MTLERIRIQDFRCLASVDFQPDHSSNIIVGENASGKTSLLEAIFFLGRGRSFRSNVADVLVREGQATFRLVGNVAGPDRGVVVGVEVGSGVRNVRIGGVAARGFGDLAEFLPVQVVDPDVHKLIEDGPSNRRQFLDFGVFHVEHHFLVLWRRYQRALKQRNRSLKTDPRVARAWDVELAASGEGLAAMRSSYLEALAPLAAAWVQDLLQADLHLVLRQGWSAGRTLAETLEQGWERDREFGATQAGPHRADLEIKMQTRSARGRVSRGQQKLLAAALLLAQVELMESRSGPGVLLLDDPSAELDVERLERLMARVSQLRSQRFVTGLSREALEVVQANGVFHVEQGILRRVV